MAELTTKERLQPSLLDRLTDEQPELGQESRDRRVLSLKQLREGVIRDLSWLLNTCDMASCEELDEYPDVAKSVLNYGMPDLTGKTSAGLDVASLEKIVRQAIWDFEPRLLRESVTVRAVVVEDQMNHNAVSFEIEGQLWAQPLPLQLYLKTDIDLETGSVAVTESSVGGGS